MPKVEINPIQNLDNPNTVVDTINGNFNRIQAIIETLLSRDGRVPNSMLADFNMNENRVLNLPVPVSPQEPARHGDIQQYVDQAEAFRDEAEGFRNETEDFRNETEGFRDEAEDLLTDFQSRYLGTYATNPSVDNSGNPLIIGSIYFNTAVNNWRVFAIDDVHEEGEPVYAGDPQVIIGYWIPFPQASVLSQNDVDADTITNNQLLVYSGDKFIPWDPIAAHIAFDDDQTLLNAGTVQEAIEDLVDRTSLGKYDIMCYAQDLLVQNEQVFRLVASRTFWLPVNGGDSLAISRVPANNTQVLSLRRNGVQFGTITFNESSTGVWAQAGTEVFDPGDVLSVVAIGTADTALRDISITFAARR